MKIKNFTALASTFLLTCLPSHAQQHTAKVLYSKNVPHVVRQRVPRGGKSWFFGDWNSTFARKDILFHLYSAPTRSRTKGYTNACVLDVFERSDKKGNRIRRVNSVKCNPSHLLDRISTDIMWVDPKNQHLPVLRLQFLPEERFKTDGTYLLINFPQGFRSSANVQEFRCDQWGNITQHVTFNKVDERGFTMVTVSERDATNEGAGYDEDYRWIGDKFGAPRTTILEGIKTTP